MIDHVSVGANDIARSRRFYDAVLGELGLRVLSSDDRSAYYGTAEIVFSVETPLDGKPASSGNGVHIAFSAGKRSIVNAWRMAAQMRAHRSCGPNTTLLRGLHLRPDGNKIEAVTRSAQ